MSQPEVEPSESLHKLLLSVRQSVALFATSLLLALVADGLFFGQRLGLNISLFALIGAATLWAWTRHLKTQLHPLLLGSFVLMACMFSWRDSLFLQVLNLSVQLFLGTLLTARATHKALSQTDFLELGLNAFRGLFNPVAGVVLFFTRSRWEDLTKRSNAKTLAFTVSSFRGLVLALPLIVIFGFLLSSADANFERLVQSLFSFELDRLLEHGFFTGFAGFVLLGVLTQSLVGSPWLQTKAHVPAALRVGNTEVGMVLGSLVFLFSAFMVLQFPYLFGGEGLLVGDLSYASYAQRGFFELVTVTFLLHVVLLVGLWLSSATSSFKLFRTLATVLIALLFGIIWSAYSRLGLYIQTYGLTELRYYSSAMTLWIGAAMLYFVLRLYYRKAARLAYAYLVLGVLGVTALYVSSPDARIAQVNLSRAETSELDLAYLERLSQDAVPVLAAYSRAYSDTPTAQRLSAILDRRYDQEDWRSFNWGRWRAQLSLEQLSP